MNENNASEQGEGPVVPKPPQKHPNISRRKPNKKKLVTVPPILSTTELLKTRGSAYGRFEDNAKVCQEIRDALRRDTAWYVMEMYERQALDEIALKMARAVCGKFKEDNYRDIEGYGALVLSTRERLERKRKQEEADAVRKLKG